MAACFTFDIEPHDRIEAAVGYTCPPGLRDDYSRRMAACTRWLLDTLAEAQARATFFVVGQVAETHPDLIREIAAAGHEVGCHSWDHRRIHRFSPDGFRADLRQAVDALEQAAGQPVLGFRAPTFSITRETAWAVDVLAEEGFQYDSSVFPVRHDRYGIPDAPRFPYWAHGAHHALLELPPATLGLGTFNLRAAGGGYFRLFPLAVIRAAVRQAERHPNGVPVLYFHPWEFDADQPRLPVGRMARFRTYTGIAGGRARLGRLLARFGSRRMIDAVDELHGRGADLPVFALTNPMPVAPGVGSGRGVLAERELD